MLSLRLLGLVFLSLAAGLRAQVQSSSVIPIPASPENGLIRVSVDKPVYFPGGTVHVTAEWTDSASNVTVTPFLAIGDALLHPAEGDAYALAIPADASPGSYRVRLEVSQADGRLVYYDTDCFVNVEEYQAIEQVADYVYICPDSVTGAPPKALTLEREQLPGLQVVFQRDRIRARMGPQFVTISVEVQSRNGTPVRRDTRRMVTFRSQGDPVRDHAMFLRYRSAYGPYTTIRPEELERVQIQIDSVPNWAIIKVRVEPDYAVTIGANDRSNFVVRYFRVKGPAVEAGLALGVPKVLWDSRAKDSVDYGSTSAMVRLYFLDGTTGQRFPFSLGIGTFGVDSPIDVGRNRGGYAVSVFLDMVEIVKRIRIDLGGKVNAGLELTPFFPVEKKVRLLLNAKVGLSL
jgi:hypothetical protein